MSICQRADGRFVVRYKSGGTWKQKAFRDVEEARAFDREMADALINADRLTLLEGVIAFLRSVPHCELKIWQYKHVLLTYAADLKDRFIDTLNRRDLEALRESCRAGGIKPATINGYVGLLNAALNWCAEDDHISENPWRKYRALPAKHKHHAGKLEHVRAIYRFLPAWMQWATQTMLALCLRPGKELFSLRWDAFRWDEGCVEVWMNKVKAAKYVYPPQGYLQLAAEHRAQADESDFVCPCPYSQTGRGYINAWRRACLKAGIPPFPMYAVRHIAASQMIAAGADIAAVAAQLGHRDVTTTGAYYIHAVEGAQRRAGALLGFGANLDPWCKESQ